MRPLVTLLLYFPLFNIVALAENIEPGDGQGTLILDMKSSDNIDVYFNLIIDNETRDTLQ